MKVKLTQPLNRGRVEGKVNEIVEVPDGLGRRLVERGRACDPAAVETPPAEPAATPAAPAPSDGRKRARKPE